MKNDNICMNGLAHVGQFVSDLEETKKFHIEKLDFEVLHENSVTEKDGITKVRFLAMAHSF